MVLFSEQLQFVEIVMEKFKSYSIVTKLPQIFKELPKFAEIDMRITKYVVEIAKLKKRKHKNV